MSRSRAIRWLKWGVVAAALLIAAAVGVRLWLLDGWLRTVRIDGASMATTLCGTHLAVTCSDCGISFRCDGEHLPESGRLVCPNCGFRELEAADFPVHAGDTVLADRWPLLGANPQRWAVVAFDDPLAGGLSVKRVAGLPGEKLSIKDGDLYANGQIVRKPLAEFEQVAGLVHDNDFQPKSQAGTKETPFLRWSPRSADSDWRPVTSGFRYQPRSNSAASAPDWLEYVHWRCDASLTPRDEPAAILDNDPYNQAQPRRLNEVSDLLLSCNVELSAGGELILALHVRGKWLEVRLDAQRGSISASHDGRELAKTIVRRKLTDRPLRIAFGQFDAQLLLAIDGEVLLVRLLDDELPPAAAASAASNRLRIAAGGAAVITHIQVWRDQYLLEPRGTDRQWTADQPLARDELLVLGDNPPVSIDSRHWKRAGLPRSKLRGVVIRGTSR